MSATCGTPCGPSDDQARRDVRGLFNVQGLLDAGVIAITGEGTVSTVLFTGGFLLLVGGVMLLATTGRR